MECKTCCKGSAPYYVCRHQMRCACHAELDALARRTPNKLPWADHTADKAIGRTGAKK